MSSSPVIVDCLCSLGFVDRQEESDDLLTSWPCSLISAIVVDKEGSNNCSLVSAGSGELVGGSGSSTHQHKN